MSEEPRPEPPGPDRPQLRPTVIISAVHFGQVLRGCRLAAGIRVDQLAEHLHVNVSTIHNRETARRSVTISEAVETLEIAGYRLIVAPEGWPHPS